MFVFKKVKVEYISLPIKANATKEFKEMALLTTHKAPASKWQQGCRKIGEVLFAQQTQ